MTKYRSFAVGFEAFKGTTKKRLNEIISRVAEDLLTDVQRSPPHPVLSGWSRASWQLTVNRRGIGVYSYSRNKFVTLTREKDVRPPRFAGLAAPPHTKLPKITAGDKVFLTNNVPYIGIIETKYGMLKASMQRAMRNVAKIARELNK